MRARSPVRPGRSSGCRLRTGRRSDAAISAMENRHFKKMSAGSWGECRHRCRLLVQDLPWTDAWGCRSPSLPEPNTASHRRRVWPGMDRREEKNSE